MCVGVHVGISALGIFLLADKQIMFDVYELRTLPGNNGEVHV